MNTSNYRSHKEAAWSYATMIRQTLPNGTTIGNITKYSVTTSKHQTQEGVRACRILIDQVPRGCYDLEQLALQRGLLFRLENEVTNAVIESRRHEILAASPTL